MIQDPYVEEVMKEFENKAESYDEDGGFLVAAGEEIVFDTGYSTDWLRSKLTAAIEHGKDGAYSTGYEAGKVIGRKEAIDAIRKTESYASCDPNHITKEDAIDSIQALKPSQE